MTKTELLAILKDCHENPEIDTEEGHGKADNALLDFINDPEIREAYGKIAKWYA